MTGLKLNYYFVSNSSVSVVLDVSTSVLDSIEHTRYITELCVDVKQNDYDF